MADSERALVFLGTWIALAVLAVIAHFRATPEFKIRWFPPFIVFVGVLFVAFSWWLVRSLESLYIAVPAAAIFTFLNLRYTRFCTACGYPNRVWGRGVDYCYKCRLQLPASKPRHE
jgi:hypothetical protein